MLLAFRFGCSSFTSCLALAHPSTLLHVQLHFRNPEAHLLVATHVHTPERLRALNVMSRQQHAQPFTLALHGNGGWSFGVFWLPLLRQSSSTFPGGSRAAAWSTVVEKTREALRHSCHSHAARRVQGLGCLLQGVAEMFPSISKSHVLFAWAIPAVATDLTHLERCISMLLSEMGPR